MRYADIRNGVITNIVECANENYARERGWVLLSEGYGIGDLYIKGQFHKNETIIGDLQTMTEQVSILENEKELLETQVTDLQLALAEITEGGVV